MKERPILFNDEMVRAILEGRKLQTRRLVKSIDHDLLNMMSEDIETGAPNSELLELLYGPSTDDDGKRVADQWLVRCSECPEEGVLTLGQGYGNPGDRLWVREAFHKCPHCSPDGFVAFRAIGCRDSVYGINNEDDGPLRPKCAAHGWKPSIHMPRLVSRITLEITDVRVERLQDITEEDARAEGISDGGCLECGESEPCGCDHPTPDARDAFIHLWQSIYGRESWAANPWVWVIEFRRVDQ